MSYQLESLPKQHKLLPLSLLLQHQQLIKHCCLRHHTPWFEDVEQNQVELDKEISNLASSFKFPGSIMQAVGEKCHQWLHRLGDLWYTMLTQQLRNTHWCNSNTIDLGITSNSCLYLKTDLNRILHDCLNSVNNTGLRKSWALGVQLYC